ARMTARPKVIVVELPIRRDALQPTMPHGSSRISPSRGRQTAAGETWGFIAGECVRGAAGKQTSPTRAECIEVSVFELEFETDDLALELVERLIIPLHLVRNVIAIEARSVVVVEALDRFSQLIGNTHFQFARVRIGIDEQRTARP